MSPRKTAAERAAEAEETQVVQTIEPAPEAGTAETDAAADAADQGVEPTPADSDGNDSPVPADPDVVDPDPTPDPDPDIVEPEQETGDADALQYDPNRLGAPEPYVHKGWPHVARGQIVRQLFEAADVLNYPHDVIRSTSDGFRYPESIDRYLFPSEYR